MNILLTGATGFIGSSILSSAKSLGINLRTVIREGAHPTNNSNFKDPVIVSSIDGETDWHDALVGVNIVIHCAARAHIMHDLVDDPLAEYCKVNVSGTLNLARQSVLAGVKRFIFLSTIKVNGSHTQTGNKFKSEDIPNPEDAYAISKFEAEQLLLELSAKTGIEVVIIRPPLVYGRGVKANFQSLMKLVCNGLPLPLAAVNDNRRSLVGVDNLVDLIITCINHPAAANQVFLVSDDEDLSTAELLNRMYKANGTPNRLFTLPLWFLNLCATMINRKSLYARLCGSLQVDICKSKELLGWTPPVSVDEGLRRAFGRH